MSIFPTSPTDGQTVTDQVTTWQYVKDDNRWVRRPDDTNPVITIATTPALLKNTANTVYADYAASEPVTWSLQGANAASFSIDTDGTVRTAAALADGNYNITVVGTDTSGNVGTLAQTIEVDGTAPTITAVGTATDLLPTSAANTVARDYNANEAVTWSLEGADAAHFNISTIGTVTTVATGMAERDYTVTIRATDDHGNTSTTNDTYTVEDPVLATGLLWDDGVVTALGTGGLTSATGAITATEGTTATGYTVTFSRAGTVNATFLADQNGSGSGSDQNGQIRLNGGNVASAGASAWRDFTVSANGVAVTPGDVMTFVVQKTCWRCFGGTVTITNASITGV